mmetsp:Transcript_8984/g.17872  ORF Transcript_8984/g.17872 Transcript_8984/m.17872 type:complete len:229 (-) Transcript_8984:498-1184(-)
MGTALGTTQGSWRPLASNSMSSPSLFTVFCFLAMVAVGLKAILSRMSSPFDIPPCTPPDLFVFVRTRPSSMKYSSLCSLPSILEPENPLPISNPFVAGRDITAFASSASSLSKTGDPRPFGHPFTTHVTSPPHDSPRVLTSSIALYIKSAAFSSGHRTGLLSIASIESVEWSTLLSTSLTLFTYAKTSVPATSFKSFFAIAPAATLPIVSRAEERPPPATALIPYLKS